MYVPEIPLSNKAKKVLLWWLQRESLHESPSSYIFYFIFLGGVAFSLLGSL